MRGGAAYAAMRPRGGAQIFEVDPPAGFTSRVDSLSLHHVSRLDRTFVEWTTDFSADASAEVTQDCKHKKLEAFREMHGLLEAGARGESDGSRREQTRANKESGSRIENGSGPIGGDFAPTRDAEFIPFRVAMLQRLYEEQQAELAAKPKHPITVRTRGGKSHALPSLLRHLIPSVPQITLPDGSKREGMSWETTPLQVAEGISKGLAQKVVVAKVFYADGYNPGTFVDADEEDEGEDEGVDTGSLAGRPGLEKEKSGGHLWDLTRPLEHDCTLHLLKARFARLRPRRKLLRFMHTILLSPSHALSRRHAPRDAQFDDPEGRTTFWHSSAHVLGQALENALGVNLCIGPPLKDGFYYDAYMGDHHIDEARLKEVEKEVSNVTKAKQPFQRVVLTKTQALELFKVRARGGGGLCCMPPQAVATAFLRLAPDPRTLAQHNPFKVQLVSNKIPDGGMTTAYRCGNLVDLCTGPHVPHTGKIKAFAIVKVRTAAVSGPKRWVRGQRTRPAAELVRLLAGPSRQRRAAAGVRGCLPGLQAAEAAHEGAGGGVQARPPPLGRGAGAWGGGNNAH